MFHWILRKIAVIPVRRRLRAFEEATHHPREVQGAVRQGILARHADTDFGREHHFRDIASIADFRRRLPVSPYEYFEPYITKVTRGNYRALLSDRKIHMFAMTSGTTAARKYIPVTPQ